MDFISAVKHVFANYADFSGRARRSEYWWFFLFTAVVGMVAGTIDGITGIPILYPIFALGVIIPGIATAVRRMHDIDRSGWFVLVGLVPILGFILLIYWFVNRGTVGPNQYGADPYDAPVTA